MNEQNYNSLSANLPEANFYQIITENASDGVVVLDTDSKYTYISPSSYHMFGYEPDEMHLLEPMELTHPDDLQFVLSEIQKTFENPNYKPTLEYRFRKKNGDWVWIESKISNLYHHNSVNGLVINFKDITERKAYIDRLKYISKLQSVVIEIGSRFMNASLNDVDIQKNSALEILGRFIDADRTYIFKYDFEKKIAINTHEWCKEGVEPQILNLQNVSFDEMGYWPEVHAKGMLIEIPDMDLEQDEEVKKALSEQGIKSLIAIPIMQNNICIGFAGLDSVSKMQIFDENVYTILRLFAQQLSDFNKKLNAESLLKTNELRYRLTQEVGGIGSWEYCLKTKKYWNSHQLRILFGVDDEFNIDTDEINRQIQSTICNPMPVNQALINLVDNNKPYDIEFEIIRQNDREKRILYSHAELVPDFDCNFTLVRGIVRDITERRNREQKLKNSEALLAATLRHSRFGIWSVDLNHNLLYFNETFANDIFLTFGLKLEVGIKLIDVLPEQMQTIWLDRYNRTFANQSFIEEDVVEIGDKKIYIEVSSTPIIVDGEVIGASFYGEDITDRKEAGAKLIQNAENLSKLLKASNLFVKPKYKNIDFDEVIDFLRQISGARYVVFNRLYTDFSQAVSLVGLDNTRDILKKYLKIDFIAEKWKRNYVFDSKWLQNKLTIFENFDQVLNSEFNPTLVKLFLSRFKIGNVAVARIDGNERVVGNLIFVYEKGKVIENPELIEMFSYQLGQYLERLNAEEALLQKVNEMERFHKLTVNRELNMIELKREVNELLRKLGQEEKYRVVN
jgi:PAS domain S-box-containing protein